MDNDQLVRSLLVSVLFIGFASAFRYRLRSRTDERLDRTQEGWVILIALRLFGLATFVTTALWCTSPASNSLATISLPLTVRLGGVLLGVLGFAWVVWTFHTLGHNLTDTVVTRRNATLITNGPYRFVRHPLYLGLAGVILFLFLATGSALILAFGTGALATIAMRTAREEARLVERFGDAYRAYCLHTPRFLPRLGQPVSHP